MVFTRSRGGRGIDRLRDVISARPTEDEAPAPLQAAPLPGCPAPGALLFLPQSQLCCRLTETKSGCGIAAWTEGPGVKHARDGIRVSGSVMISPPLGGSCTAPSLSRPPAPLGAPRPSGGTPRGRPGLRPGAEGLGAAGLALRNCFPSHALSMFSPTSTFFSESENTT